MKIKRIVTATFLALATAVTGALFSQTPAHADHTVPIGVAASRWEKTSFQCGTAEDGRKKKIWKIEVSLSVLNPETASDCAMVEATFNAAYSNAAWESAKSKVNFPKRDEVVPSSGAYILFPVMNYWMNLSICV